MAGDDMNTRTRLNWETARRWSYALEYQILTAIEDEQAIVHLHAIIAEMRREVE